MNAIAAEPGGESAWVALDSQSDATEPSPLASALVARISADGTVSDEQTLPLARRSRSGHRPQGRGEADRLSRAARLLDGHHPGMAVPSRARKRTQPARRRRSGFAGLITYRPPDEGLPQVAPDAPPVDDSGLLDEAARAHAA